MAYIQLMLDIYPLLCYAMLSHFSQAKERNMEVTRVYTMEPSINKRKDSLLSNL